MNVSEMADRLGLDEDEYMDLLLLFIESELLELNRVHSHLERGDIAPALELVHSMKGAAGNLGLMDVYDTSRELESKIRDGDLDGHAEYTKKIRKRLFQIAGLTLSYIRA